jgi:arylsulfatase A-like enzyme
VYKCYLSIVLTLIGVAHAAERPNIVLIMADDMGYSDIGCYGGEINTPNLDKMASEGLRFTQFYNAGRCCPTRASLLTGLYPHQAGMGGMVNGKGDTKPAGPYQGYLNEQCVTIAEVLKTAGYGTYMSGKWHVGEERPHWPTDRGFDRYYGLISGGMNYFDISKGKAEGVTRRFAIDGEHHRPPNKDWYLTDAISDYAVQYLDEASANTEPFFLYVAYTAPHWPLHAPEEDIQRYLGKYKGGWKSIRAARHQRMIDMGLIDEAWGLSAPDEETADWNGVEDQASLDRQMAVYAAQVDVMDRGIGEILSKLDSMGATEDTLVLFLSDNGGCHEGGPLGFDRRNNEAPVGGVDSYMSYGRSWANMSNTPFRMYKHWVHEGGIATPLVARWPKGISARGGLTREPGHIVDIMATCVALSGADYPGSAAESVVLPLEGNSLVPVFTGKGRPAQEPIFWEHKGNRAIRRGDWKLVAKKGGRWELYNISADRTEMKNLSEKFPARVTALKATYAAWARRVGVDENS